MTTRRQFLLVGTLGTLNTRYSAAQAQTRPAKIGLLGARPLAESVYGGGDFTSPSDESWRSR
jgi:hypothetical protein